VFDIGSNSVRLVAYEGLTRSPTPIFNEKVLAGLGREVQTTGLLAPDAVEKALGALMRFRALCQTMGVKRVWAIATAACRDARNGRAFIAEAQRICGTKIDVLSGRREAELSALGVVSGIYRPDGIVGDLGGGSLELAEVHGHRIRPAVTLPLGGLALQDISARSLKNAARIVERALADVRVLREGRGRNFYAVGGTWRALSRLHMWQTGYPLHVMHGYVIPAKEASEFSRLVQRVDPNTMSQIEIVAEARRPLLAYAAVVLEHIVRISRPRQVVMSALGVREGLLYSLLGEKEKRRDPLIAAAQELNVLRSRSPRHGEELAEWAEQFMASTGIDETPEEKRLRHAACLMADIGWRAHPDYRGEQSLNLIANGNFGAITHEGRAFLGLTVYYRYAGLGDEGFSPKVAELIPRILLGWAQILGSTIRVAHLISAAQTGVLPATRFKSRGRKLTLVFKPRVAPLAGDRVANRFRQLARLVGRSSSIEKRN
jgi:exopolyphosphatase/guanosine-5'-triphosphate,3'-diphosphate pyrophosphatase